MVVVVVKEGGGTITYDEQDPTPSLMRTWVGEVGEHEEGIYQFYQAKS